MNEPHIEFQSLSRAEAIDMHKKFGQAVIHAYKVGLYVASVAEGMPIHALLSANKTALDELGFALQEDEAAGILATALREAVKDKEGVKHDSGNR